MLELGFKPSKMLQYFLINYYFSIFYILNITNSIIPIGVKIFTPVKISANIEDIVEPLVLKLN